MQQLQNQLPEDVVQIPVHDKRLEGRARAVEDLLDTIGREGNRRRKRRVRLKWAAAGLVLLAGTLHLLLEGSFKFQIPLYWIALGLFALYEVLATRAERSAARRLAELDDPRAAGALVDALELHQDTFRDRATMKTIKGSLCRILQRGEPEFTERQLNILSEVLLRPEENSELIAEALRAVARHGHLEAREAVAPLARLNGRSENDERIREAARDCLSALDEVEQRSRAAQTLLRPSKSSGDLNLLRPGVSASPDSQNLLHSLESGAGTPVPLPETGSA